MQSWTRSAPSVPRSADGSESRVQRNKSVPAGLFENKRCCQVCEGVDMSKRPAATISGMVIDAGGDL
jgi:hypothetical protein